MAVAPVVVVVAGVVVGVVVVVGGGVHLYIHTRAMRAMSRSIRRRRTFPDILKASSTLG